MVNLAGIFRVFFFSDTLNKSLKLSGNFRSIFFSGRKKQPKQKFRAGYSWDIRDPHVGISLTRPGQELYAGRLFLLV